MSYLAGIMDGLGDASRQNERSTRLQMDMEQRRAALQNDALANARQDERLQMERDKAVRDARDSDFQHEQRTEKAGRDARVRSGIANAFKTHLSEREEALPDGTKRVVKPDPSDLKVQTALFSDIVRVKAENGAFEPDELKQLYGYRKELEKDGSLKAFQSLLAGDGSGVAAKLKEYGLDPNSMRLVPSKDQKTGIQTTKLVGQGKGGAFEMDMTPLMMALGLPDVDLDKQTNDRALTGARIQQAQREGEGALMRGRAAMVRASDGGGGGRPEFTTKDVVNEKNRLFDDMKGGVLPNRRFGWQPKMVEDDPFRRETVGAMANKLIDDAASGKMPDPNQPGKYLPPFLLDGPRARQAAESRFTEWEDRALDALASDPAWAKARQNPQKAFQMREEMFNRLRQEAARRKAEEAAQPADRRQALQRN